MSLGERWKSFTPQLLALLRITSAFMLIQAGTMKHWGWPMAMPNGVTLPAWSQVWIGGWIEIIGGVLVLVGLFTRPTAFLISGMLAVAYWQYHYWPARENPAAIWPSVNGGVPAALYCFVYLFISAAGPGAWSLEGALGRGRSRLPSESSAAA